MRSDTVVVMQSVSHSLLQLCKGEEENHIEALISQLAIEALDVAVLNEDVVKSTQRPHARGSRGDSLSTQTRGMRPERRDSSAYPFAPRAD